MRILRVKVRMSWIRAILIEKVEHGQTPGAKDSQRIKLLFVVIRKTEKSSCGENGRF